MSNITTLKTPDLSASQLRLVKNTIAKDLRDDEFNLFMAFAKNIGLDPFKKHIFPVVFNAKDANKRNVVQFIGRDGRRILAQRSGDYRPASEPTRFEEAEGLQSDTNPLGLISATVTLYKQDRKGDWYPVIGEAYWDEFAPVKPVWAWNEEQRKRLPTDEMELGGKWKDMPRLMLTKCAEAQALRAGWPDTFSGVYSEEEFHRVEAEQDATEEIEELEKVERQAMLGGPGLLMTFDETGVLDKVPMGQVHDRVAEHIQKSDPEEVMAFEVRNRAPLRDFWAHDKAAALELKELIEKKSGQFDPTKDIRRKELETGK